MIRIVLAALLLAAACAPGGENVFVDEVGWTVVAADPESREVLVQVGVGDGCSSLDRVVVDEDADHVRIRAWVRRETGRGCTLDCSSAMKELDLREPLGNREIVASSRPGRCRIPATTTTTTPRPA